MLGGIVQVILAIVLVILLFTLAFFVYNSELLKAMQNASRKDKEVPVFTGIVDFATNKNTEYEVRDETHPSYREITPSYNQLAGAEFTYNFWLYTDFDGVNMAIPGNTSLQRTDTGLQSDDIVLLLKGSKTPYNYRNICSRTRRPVSKNDVLVKCPLIKLQRGGDVLVVEFNTLSSPEGIREQSRNTCADQSTDWKYMNSHKIAVSGLRTGPNAANYAQKWYMVTVIIQDTNPTDPAPLRNKCRCRIFINGTLELDRYVDGSIGQYNSNASVLRQNNANLHVAPVLTWSNNSTYSVANNKARKMMMADLTYYNYAMDPATIAAKFDSGFTKSFAVISTVATDPLMGANVDNKSYPSENRQLSSF